MATATAQDLIDAMDRLTQAVKHLQNQQAGGHPLPGQPGGPPGPPAPGTNQPPPGTPTTSNLGNRKKTPWSRLQSHWRKFGQARDQFQSGNVLQATKKGTRTGKSIGRSLGRLTGIRGGMTKGGKIGGVVGGVVTVIVGVTEAFIRFKRHIHTLTEELVQAQRRLAEVSPSMAAAMARRDVQELMRDQRKGEALSSSAERLFQSEQHRKSVWMPAETMWDKLQNELAALGNDLVSAATLNNGLLHILADKLTDNETDRKANMLGHQAAELLKNEKDRIQRQREDMDRLRDRIQRWPGM